MANYFLIRKICLQDVGLNKTFSAKYLATKSLSRSVQKWGQFLKVFFEFSKDKQQTCFNLKIYFSKWLISFINLNPRPFICFVDLKCHAVYTCVSKSNYVASFTHSLIYLRQLKSFFIQFKLGSFFLSYVYTHIQDVALAKPSWARALHAQLFVLSGFVRLFLCSTLSLSQFFFQFAFNFLLLCHSQHRRHICLSSF